MAEESTHGAPKSTRAWALARRQHGVITRAQLLALGYTESAIYHRLARGRLHRVHRGVFAVGSPHLTQHGLWKAATLACGPGALLSHNSAAQLWGIRATTGGPIHVSIPSSSNRRVRRISLHRRRCLAASDHRTRFGIPVTSPVRTLADLAIAVSGRQLEAAVNEADKLDLVDPERLRLALDQMNGQPGTAPLRKLLDRETFRLTASELERWFLPIVRTAGMPLPETKRVLNDFEVDFFWPDIGLVVETDGLRYHRTPTEQARDRLRDQAHTASGLVPLRFTHAQIRFQPDYVGEVLRRVLERLTEKDRL